MTKAPHLSLILPVRDAADTLPFTLAAADHYLHTQDLPYEILVVNDGSRDRTAEVAARMGEAMENVKVVDNAIAQGIGAAARQGVLVARGTYRLIMGGESAVGIEYLGNALPLLQDGVQVVFGSRLASGSRALEYEPLHRRVIRKAGALALSFPRRAGAGDPNSGFVACSAEVAERLFLASRVSGAGFGLELLGLARSFGYRVGEVPVAWAPARPSRLSIGEHLKIFLEDARIHWWLWTGMYRG